MAQNISKKSHTITLFLVIGMAVAAFVVLLTGSLAKQVTAEEAREMAYQEVMRYCLSETSEENCNNLKVKSQTAVEAYGNDSSGWNFTLETDKASFAVSINSNGSVESIGGPNKR